jgi:hypothetical protein
MQRVHWILIAGLLIAIFFDTSAIGQSSDPKAKYAATIPPEILDQFDPRVLAGTVPKVVTISRDMIWSLRDDPDHGGDAYRFDFQMGDITSVQRGIIAEWIARGNDILLWGFRECLTFNGLLDAVEVGMFRPPGFIWSTHVVNTDVDPFKFGSGGVGFYVPPYSDVIYGKEDSSGEYDIAFAGRVAVGDGNIVFACLSTEGSLSTHNDYHRWFLNFHQWVMGLPVPGAAAVGVD